MKLLKIAARYLKGCPLLAALTLGAIVLASVLEGASFGMLIPLIQGMTQGSSQVFKSLPFAGYFEGAFSWMGQASVVGALLVLMLVILTLKNLFVYISDVLMAKIRFGMVRDLRIKLMGKLLSYDMKFFDSVKTGYLISNFEAETVRMGEFILSILQLIALSGRVIAYIGIMLFISWKASLVIFFLMAVVLLPIELLMAKMKKIGELISEAIVACNYKITETLGGIRLIKGSGTEESEKSAYAEAARRHYAVTYKNRKYSALIIPLSEVLIFVLIVSYFLIFINATKINITIVFPFVAAYLVIMAKMLTQMNALNTQRAVAISNIAAFESYETLTDENGKRSIESGSVCLTRFKHSIELKDVRFSYIEGKEVLKGVTISIPRGKITALVGASGSGKSTIINLIMRFYDVTGGAIFVDGMDIKDLALNEWRRRIGFVSQDTFIFNTSVKDNVSYGRFGVSEEDVVVAAKIANAHDFIMHLPDGYRTVLGERGVKLSGGQKQRISISRAIIHNPEILILDEATSSLDTETEKLIREAIDRVTKDRTVIAIAHRLSTILHADNIAVLGDGRVTEAGRHAELINNKGSYKRLYDTQ